MQRETCASLLGDAIVETPAMPALAPLLLVFGLQRMRTRFLLRRLGFAHAVSCSRWRCGDRAKLVDLFVGECATLRGFGAASTTGGTRDAIADATQMSSEGLLGDEDKPGITAHWPDCLSVGKSSWRLLCRHAVAWHESCWRQRKLWNEETGTASAALLRAMQPTRAFQWL